MTVQALNHDLLPDNACYGCGPLNPDGLQIVVTRDPGSPDTLRATFRPKAHMVGFPGITHGGAMFTALDCLAAWVPAVLRPQVRALWLLRSASITFQRPSHAEQPITLVGTIAEDNGSDAPMRVHAEARDPMGELLAVAEFKVVPVPEARFLQITGLQAIPPNWRTFLDVRS
jgi:acyl-coenzyme A thioesterase PaaI-like protein